jgi:hypothetical protein
LCRIWRFLEYAVIDILSLQKAEETKAAELDLRENRGEGREGVEFNSDGALPALAHIDDGPHFLDFEGDRRVQHIRRRFADEL